MLPSRTVLLAVDDLDARAVAIVLLRRKGYFVVVSGSGIEAEELLLGDLPDLLIVDMLLPGTSGFLLTHLAKERSEGRVPVVMLSGNSAAAHRHYAFAAGVDAFLLKPFRPIQLANAAVKLCPMPAALPVAAVVCSSPRPMPAGR